jgi:hypothetical protein
MMLESYERDTVNEEDYLEIGDFVCQLNKSITACIGDSILL